MKIAFHFFLAFVAVLVIILAYIFATQTQPSSSREPPLSPVEDTVQEPETTPDIQSEAQFVIDEGFRLDNASNPLVIDSDGTTLTLAYEVHADSLKNEPSERASVGYTEDGLNFTILSQEDRPQIKPKPVLLPDGSYRRFLYDPVQGGVISEISMDGKTFSEQNGVRFAITSEKANDPDIFGVSTYFVDAQGGVVLLYNSTDDDGAIVVNRAYARPEDDWMEFVLKEEDVLDGTLESEVYADPHAIVRANGEVWLIVMNQTAKGPYPPMGRQGRLYAYVSTDGGDTFNLWGSVFSYDDVQEFDTYSLNDPKIVEQSDGTLRVYVAALIVDEDSSTNQDEPELKYVIMSGYYK